MMSTVPAWIAPVALVAVVVFLSASVSGLAAPSGSGVTVETNRRAYLPGDLVEITVTNGRKGPVFLPGCESFQLERFAEERYEPVQLDRCDREGKAQLVAPGTLALKVPAEDKWLGDRLRVSLVYGWGCTEGRALSEARCEDFSTARSISFRIRRQPD